MNGKMAKHAFFSALLLVCLHRCVAGFEGSEAQPRQITIVARKFKFDPRTISVQKGETVRLNIRSEDVDHGFAIDEFNIDRKIKAGTSTVIEFTPDREGRFRFYCSVFCGDGHPDMEGELVVTAARKQESGIEVTFDESVPGVVIVESGGERLRIDTRTKNVTRLSAQKETQAMSGTQQRESRRRALEPYDYRLINVPTPKRVPRHSLNFYFTHRFAEPIRRLPGERPGEHHSRIANDLLGLDSFSVSSFGVSYGITDRLYAMVYRSPICQRGICKTIEIGAGYHLLDEAGRSPVAMSIQASIEGERNFTETYTENVQLMIARSLTRYVHLFFSPAVHINSNGQGRFNPRPEEFFPPLQLASELRLGQHTGSFGFGVNAHVRPSVSLLFEFTPRVGFKMGRVEPILDNRFRIVGLKNKSEPEIGFGIEKRIGRHVFSLTFSNTQTTTTSRYNSSNLVLSPANWTIGFNLFRRLL
jgi:plastocyanin